MSVEKAELRAHLSKNQEEIIEEDLAGIEAESEKEKERKEQK